MSKKIKMSATLKELMPLYVRAVKEARTIEEYNVVMESIIMDHPFPPIKFNDTQKDLNKITKHYFRIFEMLQALSGHFRPIV